MARVPNGPRSVPRCDFDSLQSGLPTGDQARHRPVLPPFEEDHLSVLLVEELVGRAGRRVKGEGPLPFDLHLKHAVSR